VTGSFPHRLLVADLCLPFDWREVFDNDRPVELDLGAGDGGFSLAYAALHPEINLLAVERLLGRVRKIERRALRAGQKNLRVLRLEFSYAVRYLLPPESISVAHILFPDPWPKRRHWPRRLVQGKFVRDLARTLRPGGELRFTTDHDPYFETAQEAVAEAGGLKRVEEWDWSRDPKTDFQRTFEAEGRPIWRARWIKD
jgi:tRNA (guanine-N7-)-methyltransferase